MLIKLENNGSEYLCDLTTRLDEYAHIIGLEEYLYYGWHHYIYTSKYDIDHKHLAVRIPGGTVGTIYFDDNNIITDITLDTDYVVKSYDRNTLKKLKKEFLGEKIEFDKITNRW